MTDNEIIANEILCIRRRASDRCNGGTDCNTCDLLMNETEIIKAYQRAMKQNDLINRLQDEKQALINGQETLQNTIMEQKAEIERLKDELIISDGEEIKLRDDMYVLKDELQRAKVEISKHFDYMDEVANEAIDVFADSLKIKLNRMIDNLVKEMTEENEDE